MSVLPCDADRLLLAAEEKELLQQQEGEESKDNDYEEDQATEDDDCDEAASDTVMPESSVKTLNLGSQFIPPTIQIDLVGSKSPSPIDDYVPRYYVKGDNEKEEAIHESEGSTIDIEQKDEEDADELDETELREFALSYVKDIVSRALSSAEQKTIAKVEQPITASVGDSLQDPSAPHGGSTRTASTVDALPRPSASSDAASKVVEPWCSRFRESIFRFFRLTCLCSALRRPPPS